MPRCIAATTCVGTGGLEPIRSNTEPLLAALSSGSNAIMNATAPAGAISKQATNILTAVKG